MANTLWPGLLLLVTVLVHVLHSDASYGKLRPHPDTLPIYRLMFQFVKDLLLVKVPFSCSWWQANQVKGKCKWRKGPDTSSDCLCVLADWLSLSLAVAFPWSTKVATGIKRTCKLLERFSLAAIYHSFLLKLYRVMMQNKCKKPPMMIMPMIMPEYGGHSYMPEYGGSKYPSPPPYGGGGGYGGGKMSYDQPMY